MSWVRKSPRGKVVSRSVIWWLPTAPFRGIDVPPERAPSMIDEYPILAVVAAHAEGDHAHARPEGVAGEGE